MLIRKIQADLLGYRNLRQSMKTIGNRTCPKGL